MHEVETMAFVGLPPWHGLGTEIDIADMGNVDAFQVSAGLDWNVDLFNNRTYEGTVIHDSYYIARTNDNKVLGKSVTESYIPLQNDALFDFFRPYVEDGRLHLHTAGSLFGGKKVWVMASPMRGFTLADDDEVVSNAVFTIDHTGVCAAMMMLSPIRVVCYNTWSLAKRTASTIIKHNHKNAFAAGEMEEKLASFNSDFAAFEQDAAAMADTYMSAAEEIDFFSSVYGTAGSKIEASGKIKHGQSVAKALSYARGIESKIPLQGWKSKKSALKEAQEREEALTRIIDEAIASNTAPNIDAMRDAVGNNNNDDDDDAAAAVNPGYDLESARSDDGRLSYWGGFQTVAYISDHNPLRDNRSKDGGLDRHASKAIFGPAAGQIDHKMIALNLSREAIAA